MAFALGLNLCISRLGSVTNSILSPKISNHFKSPLAAVAIGTLMCVLSFIAAILLIGLISATEDKKENELAGEALLEKYPANSQNLTQASFSVDFLFLPSSFWLLCVLCILLYGTVVPFNATASDFLMSKWFPGDIETAGIVMR